jgi:hypothetical protein
VALTNGGIAIMAQDLIGESITEYNNGNAHIGVGDSTTAFAASQTDLQAATNKVRKGMDATYPSRAAAVVTMRSTFLTGEANWVWNEWGIFNHVTAGTMLSRKVESLGTKTSAQSWQITATLTFSNP